MLKSLLFITKSEHLTLCFSC